MDVSCITTNWGGHPSESFIRETGDDYKQFGDYYCRLQFENATEMGIILDEFINIKTVLCNIEVGFNEFWGDFWYFQCYFRVKNKDKLKAFAKRYGIKMVEESY